MITGAIRPVTNVLLIRPEAPVTLAGNVDALLRSKRPKTSGNGCGVPTGGGGSVVLASDAGDCADADGRITMSTAQTSAAGSRRLFRLRSLRLK